MADSFQLPEVVNTPLSKVFGRFVQFADPIPRGWYVAVIDVKHSTDVVMQGGFHKVNIVASSFHALAYEVADELDLPVYPIYGGDGVLVLFPPQALEVFAKKSLILHKRAEKMSDLDIRIGFVPLEIIQKEYGEQEAGFLWKHQSSVHPLFLGKALAHSERLVKDTYRFWRDLHEFHEDSDAFIKGLEFHWYELFRPHEDEAVLCVIVESLTDDVVSGYSNVNAILEKELGDWEARYPHVQTPLKVRGFWRDIGLVSSLRDASELKHAADLLRWAWNRNIKPAHIEFDTVKIDGLFKTIVVGQVEAIHAVAKRLDELEEKGVIAYGHAIAKAPIVTAVIHKNNGDAVGLLDVDEGGYALAYRELRQKQKGRE